MNKEYTYIQTISFFIYCLNSSVSKPHCSTMLFKENTKRKNQSTKVFVVLSILGFTTPLSQA